MNTINTPLPPPMHRVTHAMSFDLEDWFHLVGVKSVADARKWAGYSSIVESYTDWFLEQLETHDVRATFFIVGWIAKRYPDLIRQIAKQGHEVASHSYWHRGVYELTPNQFRDDLFRSIDVIEQVSGQKVRGYRAPSFSIKPGCEWAFDIMHEAGLDYDASLFPGRRGQGGYPCVNRIHAFDGAPSGRPIRAFPMSIMRWMGRSFAFSGGGYLRALPWWLIDKGFQQFESEGKPVVAYLHPRDFAPDTPRAAMSLARRIKCYHGLSTTEGKFAKMLAHYRFGTCADVLGLAKSQARQQPAIAATRRLAA